MMSAFEPIPEQRLALQLFLEGGSLRIDAYAGSGKTSTLRFLATKSPRRGLYLAFNRSIALDAQWTFPSQVTCVTSHSIAFRSIRRAYRYSDMKLTGNLTPNLLMEAFRAPDSITFRSGLVLPKRSYISVLLEGIKSFLQSEAVEPAANHIPRCGILEFIPDSQFIDFSQQAAEHVGAVWATMRHQDGAFPLGHDGYLKLWALSSPTATCDYIMVDEAQDLNPVLLGVLQQFACPIVYVGDPFQQIYEWRGAVNAMDRVRVSHRVLLSQSFRFGPAIADAATAIIRSIGAKQPVRGLFSIASQRARVRPDIILSRSNSGVIASVLKGLSQGSRIHVLGGTKVLERVLEDVARIKSGIPALGQELLGFSVWKDVVSHSMQPDGVHLRTLVGLVREYGEQKMLAALGKCEQEERSADIVCSTAHRAKGREWDYVRLDEDFEAAISRSSKGAVPLGKHNDRSTLEAETRLLYVAVTRARLGVEIPSEILRRFNLRETTLKIVGKLSAPKVLPKTGDERHDSKGEATVSPLHSSQKDDSPELAALRRFFG